MALYCGVNDLRIGVLALGLVPSYLLPNPRNPKSGHFTTVSLYCLWGRSLVRLLCCSMKQGFWLWFFYRGLVSQCLNMHFSEGLLLHMLSMLPVLCSFYRLWVWNPQSRSLVSIWLSSGYVFGCRLLLYVVGFNALAPSFDCFLGSCHRLQLRSGLALSSHSAINQR